MHELGQACSRERACSRSFALPILILVLLFVAFELQIDIPHALVEWETGAIEQMRATVRARPNSPGLAASPATATSSLV